MDLIDEAGLEGFTLRALGARLEVSQMAAYRYFPGRSAIIDALADQLLEEIRLDDPNEIPDPDERILSYARRARTVLLAHPALVPVVAARPLLRRNRTEDLIRLSATFRDAGFRAESIVESVLTLVSVVLGLILYEQQRAAYDRVEGRSYREERVALLMDLIERPDAPAPSEDLILTFAADDWDAEIFESTLTALYAVLKQRGQ